MKSDPATWSLLEEPFEAMGTGVLVSIAIASAAQQGAARAALQEVRRLVQAFGIEGWAWGEGALGAFNRTLAVGGRARVPAVLQPLMRRAAELAEASDGHFEPRIGALVRLWGFDQAEAARREPPPPEAIADALQALRAAPRYCGDEHYGPAPGVCWDLGAIGKGYIADLALDWLAHRGFADALVNAGGHVAARGRAGLRPWQVAIRDPRSPQDEVALLAELAIGDESVVTHGDDQRYFEHAGERHAHLLDPRSGRPARGLRSLTVVHADGALADAGGAALFAAGRDGWPALAERLGLSAVLAVDSDGQLAISDALRPRLRLAAAVPV